MMSAVFLYYGIYILIVGYIIYRNECLRFCSVEFILRLQSVRCGFVIIRYLQNVFADKRVFDEEWSTSLFLTGYSASVPAPWVLLNCSLENINKKSEPSFDDSLRFLCYD